MQPCRLEMRPSPSQTDVNVAETGWCARRCAGSDSVLRVVHAVLLAADAVPSRTSSRRGGRSASRSARSSAVLPLAVGRPSGFCSSRTDVVLVEDSVLLCRSAPKEKENTESSRVAEEEEKKEQEKPVLASGSEVNRRTPRTYHLECDAEPAWA
jgi:hypothetical protein